MNWTDQEGGRRLPTPPWWWWCLVGFGGVLLGVLVAAWTPR